MCSAARASAHGTRKSFCLLRVTAAETGHSRTCMLSELLRNLHVLRLTKLRLVAGLTQHAAVSLRGASAAVKEAKPKILTTPGFELDAFGFLPLRLDQSAIDSRKKFFAARILAT